ncbi:uncharacterized protein LOC120211033 [Hibiscus syriacus]|uniref:uncharacterized protein LOC120211033 n=1 Tax=Hibiscus syriacus TaxID=106335 RepID=UPI001921A2E6|nr:uncharacterized protein LOC120211033 [Hibiscus syriacus]
MERRGTLGSGRRKVSDQRSALEIENYETHTSQISPIHEVSGRNLMIPSSDISRASNYSTEAKNLAESPDIVDSSAPKLSFCVPSPFSPPITKTVWPWSFTYLDVLAVHLGTSFPYSKWFEREAHQASMPPYNQISDS